MPVIATPLGTYHSLWPPRDLGKDQAAAHLAGGSTPVVSSCAFATKVQGHALRLAAVSLPVARLETVWRGGQTIYRQMDATGRVWRAEERLRVFDGEVSDRDLLVDLKTGAACVAKASTADKLAIKPWASRLAGNLRGDSKEHGAKAVEVFLENLDKPFSQMNENQVDNAIEAARKHLRTLAGDQMVGAWAKRITVTVEDMSRHTKQVIRDEWLPSVTPSLRAPERTAARQIGNLNGFWVRNKMGQIDQDLSRQAKVIISRGLRNGLGNKDIAQDLRDAIPGMYEMRTGQYAETVANVAVARARSGAELFSYEEAGVEYLEVVAMLDERTTEACRLMDGQIISVGDCREVYDRGINVQNPEDIATENPFMRVTKDDEGRRFLDTRNGDRIAQIERSGRGKLDDRGTTKQFVGGKDFKGAKIGLPPYHFRCRTMTIPRMDIYQVPAGEMRRSMAENTNYPSDPVRPYDPRPALSSALPSMSNPSQVGLYSVVDDGVLPYLSTSQQLVDVANAIPANSFMSIRHTPVEAFPKDPSEFAIEARRDTDDGTLAERLANDKGFRYSREGYGEVAINGAKADDDTTIASLFINDGNAGRSTVVNVADNLGSNLSLRINRYDDTGVRREITNYRDALRGGDAQEIKKSAKALVDKAKQNGQLRTGKKVSDVCGSPLGRASSSVPNKPKTQPIGIVARPPVPQPAPPPKPPKAIPKVKPSIGPLSAKASAEKLAVSNDVFSARPDPSQMVKLAHEESHVLIQKMKLAKSGGVHASEAWTMKRSDQIVDLALGADDSVVHIMSPLEIGHARDSSRLNDIVNDIITTERGLAHKATRDWVVQDIHGNARFIRVDTSKVSALTNQEAYELRQRVRKYGARMSTKELESAGIKLTRNLDKAYPNANVDWNQRNLIPGIGTDVQAAARMKSVRNEIDGLLAAERKRLGRELTSKEIGTVIQKQVSSGGGGNFAANLKHIIPEKVTPKVRADLRRISPHLRQEAGAGSVIHGSKDAIKIIDGSLKEASTHLQHALQSNRAPVFITNARMDGGGDHAIYHKTDIHTAIIRAKRPFTADAKDDVHRTLKHEVHHWVESIGKNSHAVRYARNAAMGDGGIQDLTEVFKIPVFTPPNRCVDDYTMRIYYSDLDDARKSKPKTAKAWRELYPSDVNDRPEGTEFLTRTSEAFRPGQEEALGKIWQSVPEQVEIYTSVMRGHYTPF